jgi:hypothetical protein
VAVDGEDDPIGVVAFPNTSRLPPTPSADSFRECRATGEEYLATERPRADFSVIKVMRGHKVYLSLRGASRSGTGIREYQEFRAGLGIIGAKEPDDAAPQRTSHS